jgi:phosphatidylglycerophosphate synthase
MSKPPESGRAAVAEQRSDVGTAVRDATTAVTAAAVLCGLIALLVGRGVGHGAVGRGAVGDGGMGELAVIGALGAVAGLAVVTIAGASVVRRPARWSGPADRVTLARTVLIGGCATLAVAVATGALPARSWPVLALLVPALALDAVDGAVARHTGTASAAGARLDGEMDAALLLVVSASAVRALGWWVLGIGLMRYAFFAARYLAPGLRGRLDFSQFRRVVAGLQGVALAVALTPGVPLGPARAGVALALILLTISFGRDVVDLQSRPTARAGG